MCYWRDDMFYIFCYILGCVTCCMLYVALVYIIWCITLFTLCVLLCVSTRCTMGHIRSYIGFASWYVPHIVLCVVLCCVLMYAQSGSVGRIYLLCSRLLNMIHHMVVHLVCLRVCDLLCGGNTTICCSRCYNVICDTCCVCLYTRFDIVWFALFFVAQRTGLCTRSYNRYGVGCTRWHIRCCTVPNKFSCTRLCTMWNIMICTWLCVMYYTKLDHRYASMFYGVLLVCVQHWAMFYCPILCIVLSSTLVYVLFIQCV